MYRDEFGDWGTQSLSSNINLLIHSSSWSGSKFGRHDLMACKTIIVIKSFMFLTYKIITFQLEVV